MFMVVMSRNLYEYSNFIEMSNKRIPFYRCFGLDAYYPKIVSDVHATDATDNGLCYVYQSDPEFKTKNEWRPLGLGTQRVYNKFGSIDDAKMAIFFVEKVKSPKPERFRNETINFDGATSRKVTFETAVEDLGIDKKKFDETFANDVFMRCFCGPFGIREETAKKILEHDVKDAELRTPNKRNAFRKLVYLDGREISEVVYWLWRRKGKAGEYAGFVKAHPELFEPIADVSEFRTELGRRLLGTWK